MRRVSFPSELTGVTPNGLYTISATAEKLNVSRETIRKWVVAGVLRTKTRKIDFAVVISGKEIIRIFTETI